MSFGSSSNEVIQGVKEDIYQQVINRALAEGCTSKSIEDLYNELDRIDKLGGEERCTLSI